MALEVTPMCQAPLRRSPLLVSPSRQGLFVSDNYSLSHSGFGIWIQGPSAPDQAQRRVILDGTDMGAYNALAADRSPSKPFWGTGGLEYTTHTVVVTHNDTSDKILALDAWIVEYDYDRTPDPYTTTTTTETAPTPTITHTVSNDDGSLGINGTVAGNPDTSTADSPKSFPAVLIGILVPILFFVSLCIIGIFIWRCRRRRSAQLRRETFREKLSRHQPIQLHSPLTAAFGKRAEGVGEFAAGAGAGRRSRSSDDVRVVSPHTIASTRYETAEDHFTYEMDEDANQAAPLAGSSTSRNLPIEPLALTLDTHAPFGESSLLDLTPARASSTTRPTPLAATFDPPAEWRTTLASSPPAAEPLSNSLSQSSDAFHSAASDILTAAGAGAALASGTAGAAGTTTRARRDSPSGPTTTSTDIHRGHGLANDPKPSTVFTDTDSGNSYAGPPSRYYQHQPDLTPRGGGGAAGWDADVNNNSPPVVNARPSSVLRRFSTALASTLRGGGSRPNSRHSNSHAMASTSNNTPNAETGFATTFAQNEEDLENEGGSRGYFRGMNHFNLGIPLNYRPTATASSSTNYNSVPGPSSSPVVRSPTVQTGTRASRQSQNPNNLGFDDLWLGSGTGAGSSHGGTSRSAPTPTPLATSPFDDYAFSSYTRQTRERVLSFPTIDDDEDAAAGAPRDETKPPAAPKSSAPGSEDNDDVIEPEEKDEKIRENLDGETIHPETEDEGGWSIGHGTLASHGPGSTGGHGAGASVTRRGSSVSRQRSTRSTADQARQVS